MTNSRGYVANILAVNGKMNTIAGKTLANETPVNTGVIQDIDWSEFSKEEVSSISKMKFKKLPELTIAAKKALVMEIPQPKPTNKTLCDKYKLGPEPY